MAIRTRIGVMVPSTNTTCEADFQLVADRNVTVHGQRLWLTNAFGGDDEFDRMNAEIESAAKYLATANVDAIAYGCTTGSFYKGPGWDEEMMELIQRAAGVPAAATSPSVVEALRFFGAKRISVASPYPRYNNEKLHAYLVAQGFEVLNLRASRWRPRRATRASTTKTRRASWSSPRASAGRTPTPCSVPAPLGAL